MIHFDFSNGTLYFESLEMKESIAINDILINKGIINFLLNWQLVILLGRLTN